MNKNKAEKNRENENSDVDNDGDENDSDVNYECDYGVDRDEMKRQKYVSDDDDDDDYYRQEILNHRKLERKNKIEVTSADSDLENDDKLSYIVQAVLEELKNEKSESKNERKNSDETTIKFAKDIDKYLLSDHIKRNRYLISHVEFQRKLKKLMKSVHNLDSRDENVPKFTETEKTLMKIFFKGKQEEHDKWFMMVENNIFLNILRKISKYLKKFQNLFFLVFL